VLKEIEAREDKRKNCATATEQRVKALKTSVPPEAVKVLSQILLASCQQTRESIFYCWMWEVWTEGRWSGPDR